MHYRKKICEKIDEKTLLDLDIIYNRFDIPKSRICEEAIRYILKCKVVPIIKNTSRNNITLTINNKLWNEFKDYTNTNNYRIVHLLETGLKYVIKKYMKRIKNNEL